MEVDEVRLDKVRPAKDISSVIKMSFLRADFRCPKLLGESLVQRDCVTLLALCTERPKSIGTRPYLASSIGWIASLA